ncbi:MAG: hypothetical protein HWD58_08790 [Bacteroidota bacterium]|nr:MAG: hypothetical protein HWD58_08790 [Bacteroidota bacterium]
MKINLVFFLIATQLSAYPYLSKKLQMLSMTRTQVQNLMTSRGLIPHEIYQITDALAGQGLVRIMATSNNTFAPRPVIPTIQGASYDLEGMPFKRIS